MSIEATKPLKLFYCYAREDKIYRDELDNHLSSLKHSGQIISWSDREISPGTHWQNIIDKELNASDLILLLVSSYFMASDYCYGKEMKRALERHEAGEARVIPIILRSVDWEDAPFSMLQVLPSDAKPISRWHDRDDAFWDIAKNLRKVVKELQESLKIRDKRIADHPTIVPNLSITEQPTLDAAMMIYNGSGNKSDLDKTVPYAVRHLNGQHLGFLVGTRSDPGIKRKYKPNEDSLFAAQGILSPSSLSQLFGLFVVADGMSDRDNNGQDASRLAIQTIADFMLPRLTKASAMKDDEYIYLLVEGIQQANLAVHQNNVLKHGDMKTTVTATLLVDTVAYVANVGDSRTYLYRPSEGLKKVTVDHSVVASLVEAGIIKPDDIYTHPKRNQIYRSLGEKASVEVDSFTVQLQAGDKLLLCSDGLWDMVRDPQIEAVIKNSDPNPSVTGEALIQSALEGGGEDNVSVIVVHITEGLKSAMPRFQLLTKPDSVQLPQI